MLFKQLQVFILAGVLILQYLFEHLWPQRKSLNNWKNERYNVLIGIINLLLTLLPAKGLVWLLSYIQIHKIGLLQQIQLPYWLQLVVSILILDVWMYIWHRLNHTQPFLWKFHRFHHLDQKMNSTTAIRFHIAELWLSYPGKAAICLLGGLTFTNVIIYETLFFIAIVVHHSNIYITPKADKIYRTLFSSPGMHRIHHSYIKEDRNSNYGSLFSFWDRLFVTFKQKPFENIIFGVDDGLQNKV